MKKKYIIFFCSIICFLFTRCENKDQQEVEVNNNHISCLPTMVQYDFSGGEKYIEIYTNVPWSYYTKVDWVSLINPNQSGHSRFLLKCNAGELDSTIIVFYNDYQNDTLKVYRGKEKLVMNILDTTLHINESIQLVAKYISGKEVFPLWYSSDENVVKVDQQGYITTHNLGKAVVAISDNDYHASCNIYVREHGYYITSYNNEHDAIAFSPGDLLWSYDGVYGHPAYFYFYDPENGTTGQSQSQWGQGEKPWGTWSYGNGNLRKFTDWGINEISYRGNTYPKNTWRTLTSSEWKRILTKNQCAYFKITDNGAKGIAFFPDDWDDDTDVQFKMFDEKDSIMNVISRSDWNKLQDKGAAFFCFNGYYGPSQHNCGSAGYYWTSSSYQQDKAETTIFYCYYKGITTFGASFKCNVRLVKDL